MFASTTIVTVRIIQAFFIQRLWDSSDVIDKNYNKKIPARVLANNPSNDIAVIKTESKSKGIPLAVKFLSTKDDKVLTLGYPLISKQDQEQKVIFGRICSTSGMEDDDRMVEHDLPIQPGNAGGSLLNKRGEVIGMIAASLDEILLSRASGLLPPNINLAIKIDSILHALQNSLTGINLLPNEDMREMNLAQIVKLRESSVKLVVAEYVHNYRHSQMFVQITQLTPTKTSPYLQLRLVPPVRRKYMNPCSFSVECER